NGNRMMRKGSSIKGIIVGILMIEKENCNCGKSVGVSRLNEINKSRENSGVMEFGICGKEKVRYFGRAVS
uniref:hypothetical protein n=1 Tax=Staphylococcus aureus TaxID=1280 RepID=UPI001C931003